MSDCLKVQEQIVGIRMKVEHYLNTPKNINGCLLGTVDDYVQKFDEQLIALRERIEKDRKYWNSQVVAAKKFNQQNWDKMNERFLKFQLELTQFFTPKESAQVQIKYDTMKDLEQFGNKIAAD